MLKKMSPLLLVSFCASLGCGELDGSDSANSASATDSTTELAAWSGRHHGSGGASTPTSASGGAAGVDAVTAASGGAAGADVITAASGGAAASSSTVAASSSISIRVQASRTSCTAPCAVFFDTTTSSGLASSGTSSNDYVVAAWAWNFDATNVDQTATGVHEKTVGFAVAHVFQTPGTYSVTTAVTDASGANAGPVITTINVTSMAGTTYYVASNGNDSNNGTSPITPFQTVAKGMSKATTNNSVLFRRGDTFSGLTNSLGFYDVAGPVLVASYSDSRAPSSVNPVLNFSNSGLVDIGGSSSDIRIADVSLTKTGNLSGINITGSATNSLLLRVDAQHDTALGGANLIFTSHTAIGSFVVDSHLHHVNGYGWYGEGPIKAALIGSTIDDLSGKYHGFRWQACTEVSLGVCQSGYGKGNLEYVANNTINNPTSFTSGEFHGDVSNIVFTGNSVVNNLSAAPQNAQSAEYVSNVLFDGNFVNGNVSVTFNANHAVFRNNIMVGTYGGAFNAGSAPQLTAGWTTDIFIYNNTVYGSTPFLNWSAGAGKVTMVNNIFYSVSSFGSFYNAGSGTVVENHNLTYAPSYGGWSRPTGGGDVYGDPRFAVNPPQTAANVAPQAGSPGLNVGAAVTAGTDFLGVVRPAIRDIGALEM